MNKLKFTGLAYGMSAVAPLVVLSLLLVALSGFARADDLTGLPVDDPKDLSPTPAHGSASSSASQWTGGVQFVPMPTWSRDVRFATMPEQLKPMGKKSLAASGPAVPLPAVPPKDPSATSTTNGVENTTAGGKENPAMITVSPFLQWIKANPQAAAAAARQQAEAYHPAPPGPGAPPPSVSDQSYWLPPLIDSADFGTKPVGGSAAIYSTPQR